VIGQHLAAQCGDAAIGGRCHFTGHVIVAGEGGSLQILDGVFDPFDRHAQDDRGDDRADIARINANLVAKAAGGRFYLGHKNGAQPVFWQNHAVA
jgi:hypothetical protein